MFMGFGFLLIIGAMAAIVYALGWRPGGQDGLFLSDRESKSPLDIARERYARGEIKKDEFVQIRQDLSS